MCRTATGPVHRRPPPTIAREHAWQPVPSPVVSPPPARPTAARSVRAVGGEIADRDLVGMYLDEIARTPLLDAAKEVELSQTIEAGVYARQILDGEAESEAAGKASREELEALVAAGERAKDVFIRSNLRLVVAVARRYPRSGLPAPRPDPGGERGPGARGREVRLPQGLQVLHVRDVVDPAGHHPLHRRPVAHDPAPRPPGGGAGPHPPRAARVQPRERPRPRARGDRRRARLQARSASSTSWTGPATRSR